METRNYSEVRLKSGKLQIVKSKFSAMIEFGMIDRDFRQSLVPEPPCNFLTI